MRTRLCALLVVVAASPATASASTISLEGDTLVLRAAPGEKNWLTVGPDTYAAGRLVFSDTRRSCPSTAAR